MPVANEVGIGALLRITRADADLSIEEIAWRLRIRPELLRALEDEDFAEIGHHGFVRTLLRSYSRALDLDPADVVRRYRHGYEPNAPSSLSALHAKDKDARKHRPRSRWLLAAAVAGTLLISASVFGFLKGPGGAAAGDRSALPAGPRVLFQQASRGVRPLTNPAEQVTLRIAALQATNVSIVVDGKTQFTGTLAPGASRLVSASRLIDVDVADASAVNVWVNDVAATLPSSGRWHAAFGRHGLSGGRQPLE